VDVEQASASIDALIDKRAAAWAGANLEEESWKASVRKHNARVRREHRALWFTYYSNLAASLKTSADWYEARAAELLEDTNERSK
jgi:hypothetical protein